jgi:hypothetical protein
MKSDIMLVKREENKADTSKKKKAKEKKGGRPEYREVKRKSKEGLGCRVKVPDEESPKGFRRCGCKAWFLSPKGLRVCGTHRNKIEDRSRKAGKNRVCKFVGPEKSPVVEGVAGK